MASEIERVAWDTCVIIDAIQKTPGKWKDIAPWVTQAENGKLKIIVSEISLIECSHLKFKEGSLSFDEQHRLIDEWFDNDFVVRRPIDQRITRLAMRLAREHRLTAPDAIVLATAVRNEVQFLHTGDGKIKKQGIKLLPLSGKIGDPPITIMEPDPLYGSIFAKDVKANEAKA